MPVRELLLYASISLDQALVNGSISSSSKYIMNMSVPVSEIVCSTDLACTEGGKVEKRFESVKKKKRDRFESLSKVGGIIYAKKVLYPVRKGRVQKIAVVSSRPVQFLSFLASFVTFHHIQ